MPSVILEVVSPDKEDCIAIFLFIISDDIAVFIAVDLVDASVETLLSVYESEEKKHSIFQPANYKINFYEENYGSKNSISNLKNSIGKKIEFSNSNCKSNYSSNEKNNKDYHRILQIITRDISFFILVIIICLL